MVSQVIASVEKWHPYLKKAPSNTIKVNVTATETVNELSSVRSNVGVVEVEAGHWAVGKYKANPKLS